jgi:glutathione S-transferase
MGTSAWRALEEAGLPYRTPLLEQGDQDKPDYRALQPFGQVPILIEHDPEKACPGLDPGWEPVFGQDHAPPNKQDGRVLFESGAIVLSIGERSEALLRASRRRGRARRNG